jgi:hypothetical protein
VSPKLLVAALAAISLVGPVVGAADAQVTSAAVVGTITDTSGAALPGATVTARNVETGFVRTVPTNESGVYRLDFLPTGTYVVEISLSGFKTERRSGMVLTVNDTARVDAALAVGGVTEAVTVEGRSGDVNTATADLSKTVDAAAIQSLPLVDRNVYTLLDLTPGVQSNNNGVASASSGTSSLVLGFPERAHADQRRRRRRHRIGELLPRRRHQHDGASQYGQHPAESRRHPGIQGPDE